MEKPIDNYFYGSMSGMLFRAGDSESDKCCASVFVEGKSTQFVSNVKVGQALKYSNATAKYEGKLLWIELFNESFRRYFVASHWISSRP